ncbi:hypothetical protein HPB47_025242 [Ixodes persulcatus]|uniref:Uncharacterized protein n=1 Tax=Ixodes persulcatus TaxID=34615 RepID=A0AC60Q277_IXOPE|nr:hypothetical protein HPB47_025242 [Ixodes persulcatus]
MKHSGQSLSASQLRSLRCAGYAIENPTAYSDLLMEGDVCAHALKKPPRFAAPDLADRDRTNLTPSPKGSCAARNGTELVERFASLGDVRGRFLDLVDSFSGDNSPSRREVRYISDLGFQERELAALEVQQGQRRAQMRLACVRERADGRPGTRKQFPPSRAPHGSEEPFSPTLRPEVRFDFYAYQVTSPKFASNWTPRRVDMINIGGISSAPDHVAACSGCELRGWPSIHSNSMLGIACDSERSITRVSEGAVLE